MAYVLPQVLVFQDFQALPVAVANPMRAHISGPNAQLIRYAETDERVRGLLGFYDPLVDTAHSWPDRPAGALVDQAYTGITVQDALLQYFQDTISEGSVITKTANVNNQIRSATINFAANGTTYPRDAALLDRDVRPGDVAKVRGLTAGGDPITLWTYVKALLGDTEASVVAAATSDAANPSGQGASATVARVSGAENCVVVSADASLYDGLISGHITETYDVLVTTSSVNGDFTKATVRVISGSGTDDQDSVVPAINGHGTLIGTRGLVFTFTTDSTAGCSASATADAVTPDDLIVGQRWHVTVNGAFTKPAATSSGTYTGATSTTYVITVQTGGLYATDTAPQIQVTTTTGVDTSGPTSVPAAGTNVAVGTHGVQVQFSGLGLRAGDKYYIVATSTTVGPMRTIVLGHNLDTTIPSGSEVDLTLFIRVPALVLPKDQIGFAPNLNWTTSATQVTMNAGVMAYDASWTDSGVEQALPLVSEATQNYGAVYVTARYWLSDLTTAVNFIADAGSLGDIPGPLDPDNPLKWGVSKALENSNGTEVGYSAVQNPDSADSWDVVLSLLMGRNDVYNLVPLTRDPTVLSLYAAHVNDTSAPTEAMWRTLWVNLQDIPEIPIVSAGSTVPGHTAATTSDGLVALGVVEDDPETTGTQYTILRCTSANGNFLKNGVAPGDIVRLLYTNDGFGNSTHSEFVVDLVQAEDQLRLATALAGSISVGAKFEIWRTLNATAEATAIGTNAGAWGTRRIKAVWPDTIENAGVVMPGYFLCASLAGLSSGILPHQGMTRLQIVGYTAVPRTTAKFNRTQLDLMAGSGVWIVTQNVTPGSSALGEIYTRQAVTTGLPTDANQREEAITRNVDSISFRFQDAFDPFIGVANVTPVVQSRLKAVAESLLSTLKSENSTQNLGPQLIDGAIVSLQPSAILPDRYVMMMTLSVPYAVNNIEIHLSI